MRTAKHGPLKARRARRRALTIWTVSTLGAALVGAFVYGALARVDFFGVFGPDADVAEQLDSILTEVADDRYPARIVNESLHGSGVESYVVVLRDRDFLRLVPFSGALTSDEVRIYDVVEKELTLRFSFRPGVLQRPDAVNPYLFEVESVEDVTGDGVPEMMGSFSLFFMEEVFPTPVAIGWDLRSEQYRIQTLTGPPDLYDPPPIQPSYASVARGYYEDSGILRDEVTGIEVPAWPTELYVRTSSADGRLLVVAAYIVRAKVHASEPVLQIIPWRPQLWSSSLPTLECSFSDEPLLYHVGLSSRSLEEQVSDFWHDRRHQC